jgi:hypothetical protein
LSSTNLNASCTIRAHRFRLQHFFPFLLALIAVGCSSPQRTKERVDPDVARAKIVKLMPSGVTNQAGWAVDIFAAFESLDVELTNENICAVIAVTQQESTFTAQPTVPGLAGIARREIDSRAARYRIPKSVVDLALQVRSPNGKSYSERFKKVTTEKELSDIFQDFIGSVPLGRQLFSDWNPVRTGGPMQVSIAYAEDHVSDNGYPYPIIDSIRDEVFTRRGGIYFGIAHLLDYSASYDEMIFRFADFNAGHYASRNAAFQSAVSHLTKSALALDGDLLRYGSTTSEPSRTELAVRKLAEQIELDEAQIRSDLELEKEEAFEQTKTYRGVFRLADKARGRTVPRGAMPRIKLKSAKITRNLTTEWFAQRVDKRYKQCLARGKSA